VFFVPVAMQMLWLIAMLVPAILADTPANCTFNDVVGKWVFYEGSRIHNGSIDCRTMGKFGVPKQFQGLGEGTHMYR
jgi:hypothetical protein